MQTNIRGGQIKDVSVTEVDLSFSDVTTLDVSTSQHGLAPKITDTTKFLKGDGTWATPSASIATPIELTINTVLSVNTTYPADKVNYFSESVEIANGFFMEIADAGAINFLD